MDIFQSIEYAMCYLRVFRDETIITEMNGCLVNENGRISIFTSSDINQLDTNTTYLDVLFPKYQPNHWFRLNDLNNRIQIARPIIIENRLDYDIDFGKINFDNIRLDGDISEDESKQFDEYTKKYAIKVNSSPNIQLGKLCYVAGHSDNLYPFKEKHLLNDEDKVKAPLLYRDSPIISVKQGNVSSILPITKVSDNGKVEFDFHFFYVDKPMPINVIRGGSVFNEQCEWIGFMIMTQEIRDKHTQFDSSTIDSTVCISADILHWQNLQE